MESVDFRLAYNFKANKGPPDVGDNAGLQVLDFM